MTFQEYKSLLFADVYRISETDYVSVRLLIWYCLTNYNLRYTFYLRTCAYTRWHKLLRLTIYPVVRFLHWHLTYKLGISIPYYTQIGQGFYIGHFGGIVVNGQAVIGKNCNISQGVTIGGANRGKNKGCPVIGDNVYIATGAKIIGAVTVGNNVAIGANCVVTKDIPDNAVVVGVPGKVISYQGSQAYIERTDYANKIK